ncbi:MAG TPA: hypothetical protein VIS95_03480 [Solirubrobacterales bacterium]
MPLEGLRAWIGEVERKLGMRTRVFLVLCVIALGGAGAAIYLAVDARESSVSESDVRELQEKLEAKIAEDAGTAPATPEEPAEPGAEAPSTPESEPKSGQSGEGATGAAGDAAAPNDSEIAKFKAQLERAKEQQAAAEAEQAGE